MSGMECPNKDFTTEALELPGSMMVGPELQELGQVFLPSFACMGWVQLYMWNEDFKNNSIEVTPITPSFRETTDSPWPPYLGLHVRPWPASTPSHVSC